ncbi:MAG: hypothetical protein ABUT20_44695, partial [Bacteroidota bacterium]
MKKTSILITSMLLAAAPVVMTACHKDDDNGNSVDVTQLKKDIITDAANTVIVPSYTDLAAKSAQLLTAVQTLNATTNDANLAACQTLW